MFESVKAFFARLSGKLRVAEEKLKEEKAAKAVAQQVNVEAALPVATVEVEASPPVEVEIEVKPAETPKKVLPKRHVPKKAPAKKLPAAKPAKPAKAPAAKKAAPKAKK